MKQFSYALALLALTSCGSKAEDATPAGPVPAALTYSAGGSTVAVVSTKAYSVTAAPLRPGQDRRAFVVHSELANGYTLDLTYRYLGSAFPSATGPVVLDEAIGVLYFRPSGPGSGAAVTAPTSSGSVRVESVSPQLISGTYTGPATPGGPTVQVVFTRLAF